MSDTDNDIQKTEGAEGGFFSRLKSGLKKTRANLAGGIDRIVRGPAEIGPELWEELEEVLLLADVGISAMTWILDELKKGVRESRIREKEGVVQYLKELLVRILEEVPPEEPAQTEGPRVILVIGVNGSGKTTTIGKLAAKFKGEGLKVMLAAGDTFRAAATEQLQAWAERIDVPCVSQKSGADPSAVAFDAVQSAIAQNADRVIVDTAGRLQTNTNLMEELKKVKRVIGKVVAGAPHETLLVLDASIGQNSLSQARLFHEALQVDGLVMTKLDGSSKGGVLFNITRELNVPVRFIGVGEKVDDLQEFDANAFVEALFDR
ncbi:cell division protein FtsY [Candidatus Nitromaritima sp. SCGC AAA799-C22]|nr:cell division protein FtsY [Candidatus Nitromaritima sp. SCGC AAA799-C22]